MWSFKKTFRGNKDSVNIERVRHLILKRYLPLPYTIFDGWYRDVDVDGEYPQEKVNNPFPDLIKAQCPDEKCAIHLSGGFDSSIISYFFDRPDNDYIHVGQQEYLKARAMSKTLKGKLHELSLGDDEYWDIALDILPKFPEPETDIASVISYYASRYAKFLGHTLIVTGDCADRYFGGNLFDMTNNGLASDIWKTLHPTNLLGLRCLMPFGHPVIGEWADRNLLPQDRDRRKLFLRNWCFKTGFPNEVVNQEKLGWGGALNYGLRKRLGERMLSKIMDSRVSYVREAVDPEKLFPQLLFAAFSVTIWLEENL